MDIEENTIGYQEPKLQRFSQSDLERYSIPERYRQINRTEPEPERDPVILYSIGFKAEELLAVYAGMRAYLKALAVTDSDENLGMILRVTQILLDLNPQAVKASKSLSLKAAGMEAENGQAR